MSTVLADRRRGRLISFALAAAALAATAFVTVAIEVRSSQPEVAAGPVVPDLGDRIGDAQRITVRSTEATYRIERVQRGNQSIWVMRDRGDYPVDNARLSALINNLKGLQLVSRMTSDTSKFARLGVDDPQHGGRGVQVQIEGAHGALIVNLVLGVETGGTYVRKSPNLDQVWKVRGDLPPLRDVSAWLDLKPVEVQGEQIARVEIAPAQGPAYALARETPDAADFSIVSPRVAALSPAGVTATAERITHLSPIDVQTAPAIQGPPRARVHVVLTTGITLDGDLIDRDNKTWLKLVAHAGAPEQEQAAFAINNRAAGWAYALSADEADGLAPALSALVPQAAPRVSPSEAAPTTSGPPTTTAP